MPVLQHPQPLAAARGTLLDRALNLSRVIKACLPSTPCTSCFMVDALQFLRKGACTLRVTYSPPHAQAAVEQLPTALLEGELRLCRLVLRNTGAFPLQALRAVCSSPDAWLPPTDADLAGHGAASPSGDAPAPFRVQQENSMAYSKSCGSLNQWAIGCVGYALSLCRRTH